MKELFDEYGNMVLAAAASIMLIGFAASLLTEGQMFDVLQMFSQSIC